MFCRSRRVLGTKNLSETKPLSYTSLTARHLLDANRSQREEWEKLLVEAFIVLRGSVRSLEHGFSETDQSVSSRLSSGVERVELDTECEDWLEKRHSTLRAITIPEERGVDAS